MVNNPDRTAEEGLKPEGKLSTRSVPPAWAMTDDPLCNQWGQTWDDASVCDGWGVFVSNPHKNCTITILTLAMRNATRLAEQLTASREL